MRTVFFLPALDKSTGGLNAILELASILQHQGHTVAVTSPGDKVFSLSAADNLDAAIARLPWEAIAKPQTGNSLLGSDDLWCVPESWPNALAPGLAAGARCLVYMQSWNYPLTSLPAGVAWKDLPLRYLAVSRPVACIMREFLGVEAEAVLPPAVHAAFFAAGAQRAKLAAGRQQLELMAGLIDERVTGQDGKQHTRLTEPGLKQCARQSRHTDQLVVRVAWMPRKNKALGEAVLRLATLRLAKEYPDICLEPVPIQGMQLEQVAAAFACADIFLSTGFPEGFGLPPLEAMAAGCVPVGFSGQGGYEYMRNPQNLDYPWLGRPVFMNFAQLNQDSDQCPSQAFFAHTKQSDMPAAASTGNGLFVADGDTLAAGLALAEAARLAAENGSVWQGMRQAAVATAQNYSLARRAALVAEIWPRLIQSA